MEKLIQHLFSIGAEDYFRKMNLSVDELFSNSLIKSNPYSEHNWEIRENDQFIIVNAVPDIHLQDRLFWEEWYIFNSVEIHHHILSLWKPKSYDEIFECPKSDKIHPALTFGKRWYVIDDPDMTPWLLRR